MSNMHTTKTINYKDGQHVHHQTINYKDGKHVHHQNNWLHRWAICTPPQQLTTKMDNMYTTKTINYKDGQHVHHQTINYKDGQHVHHQNN